MRPKATDSDEGARRRTAAPLIFSCCGIIAALTISTNLALSQPQRTSAPIDCKRFEAAAIRSEQPQSSLDKSADTGEDDCQIMLLLGRELLLWGKTPPDRSQFPIFYRPVGKAFVEQCPWRRLGVETPAPGVPDFNHMKFFTQPEYSDGGRKARVSFITQIVDRRPGESPFGVFMSRSDFLLSKIGGRWMISERLKGPIT